MDLQAFGFASAGFDDGDHFGLIDDVLGHLSVGGPFSAGHRDEAAGPHDDRVVPRNRGGVRVVAGTHERPEPGEDAEHVFGLGVFC